MSTTMPSMRKTITAATVTATALLALTACSSSSTDSSASSSPTPSAAATSAEAAAGIPAEPTGTKREALLAALKAVNPSLVADADKAIDNARNQCSTISGGGNAVASAEARFSTGDHQVTEAEAKAINTALQSMLCSS